MHTATPEQTAYAAYTKALRAWRAAGRPSTGPLLTAMQAAANARRELGHTIRQGWF